MTGPQPATSVPGTLLMIGIGSVTRIYGCLHRGRRLRPQAGHVTRVQGPALTAQQWANLGVTGLAWLDIPVPVGLDAR